MGKLHSKHVCKREGPEGECILGNVHLNPAISTDGSVSHLESTTISISGNEKFNFHHLPLRVVLPPEKKVNMESDTTDNNVHTDKSVNVEEFECGVSVEGSSSDKQEWNFTLYDFDGRGKITKEDLAQLLQSLYDTVGSSINLPQTGTRTLKLKLSVSPDNAKVETDTGAVGTVALSTVKKTENVPVTSPPRKKSQSKHHKDRENCRSRERHEKSSSHAHKDSKSAPPNNQVFKLRLGKLNNTTTTTSCGAGAAAAASAAPRVDIRNNLSSGGPSHQSRSSPGKRMSTHEQKHLAELIQKNMERNQQRQQNKIRRHNSEQVTKGNNRSATRHVENPDRRNYYLDLAGIENYESSKIHNTTAPANLLDNCSAHGHGSGGHHRHHNHERSHDRSKLRSSRGHSDSKRQSRSRSYDSPTAAPLQTSKIEAAAEQIVHYDDGHEEEIIVDQDPALGAEAAPLLPEPKLQPKSASTPKGDKFRPVSLPAHLPETVSPHHHRRHRHRERNHSRAMQQVAEWINREHPGPQLPCGGEHVVVQKHEHHHIHEHHHHHHYHHYHET